MLARLKAVDGSPGFQQDQEWTGHHTELKQTYSRMLIKNRPDIIACLLLLLMVSTAILSMKDDSATSDEVAHIIAGYSYLVKHDYRLNPEHPPLLKDLAAIPLLIMNLPFPENSSYWTNDTNGQWGLGRLFLYNSGNNADQILFWSRMPTAILMLLLGFYIYKWSRELYGQKAGLLALVFYSFSPSIITNSRLVTTDLGVTFFIFIAFYYFWKFLEKPTRLNFTLATLTFTLAQLSKFTAIFLVPIFLILIMLKHRSLKTFVLMMVSSLLILGIYYQLHLVGMPLQVQHQLIGALKNDDAGAYAEYTELARTLLNSMADISLLRPYAQYLLGFLMAGGHIAGGSGANFFMGESGVHHWLYDLVGYLVKEPIASQIMLITAMFLAAKKRGLPQPLTIGIIAFCLLLFTIFSAANLQLGIRYILPIYPFIYMLTAGQVAGARAPALKATTVLLIVWLVASSLLIFPSYLSYYNELVGGPRNGYLYFVDSNTDWGQDLKRLATYVRDNSINRIKVDYFGGGDPGYYLGDRYVYWDYGHRPTDGWLAISATHYQWYRNEYSWLSVYKPVSQIGYSILVYNISR
ncbi:glycosyltransferase family 39 protein [Candidatus Bathyarchaeota archaeon]|nr:glycosyltransferase family 39 protein [Candidatus Bathyarchaeota archaeon]